VKSYPRFSGSWAMLGLGLLLFGLVANTSRQAAYAMNVSLFDWAKNSVFYSSY